MIWWKGRLPELTMESRSDELCLMFKLILNSAELLFGTLRMSQVDEKCS